jgi:hypothetical protein
MAIKVFFKWDVHISMDMESCFFFLLQICWSYALTAHRTNTYNFQPSSHTSCMKKMPTLKFFFYLFIRFEILFAYHTRNQTSIFLMKKNFFCVLLLTIQFDLMDRTLDQRRLMARHHYYLMLLKNSKCLRLN